MNDASSWTRPGWRFLEAEKPVDDVVHLCKGLTNEDVAHLRKLGGDLGILADLSRADVLMYCPLDDDTALVVAQARPHSILPIHSEPLVGRRVTAEEEPAVLRTLTEGRRGVLDVAPEFGSGTSPAETAPVRQETHPIFAPDGRVIAAICIETNQIERERHRRRSRVFQRALRQFQRMVLAGQLRNAETLTPFGEHDGVMVVDAQHRIQYVSGIATSLYRRLGYAGDLLKQRIEDLALDDPTLALRAMEEQRCFESEMQVGDLVWIKKAIPLLVPRKGWRSTEVAWRVDGVLLLIHDETEARRQAEEARVRAAIIQEIHHRVKNNLQTIASLLRIQMRRAKAEETRRALQEGINRVLSVAVIHEFLAHQEARMINIRDVGQRIIGQIREGVLDPEQGIRLTLEGPNIYLPTQPATVCALVINELLLNALKHGYERQQGGTVTVRLEDNGVQITIAVEDDGVGLPEGFDLSQSSSLGLQIVQALAEGDLKGRFELRSRDKGTVAIVTFPKHTQGGTNQWQIGRA